MYKLFISSLKGGTENIKGIDETNWIEEFWDLACGDVEIVGFGFVGWLEK